MDDTDFLKDFEKCSLCEHRCAVNRLKGETGVCRMTMPEVASTGLHPAPPESYTVFMAGCNFKCLNCQNWTISQYPDNGRVLRGYPEPKELAVECMDYLDSRAAKQMGADRIFFSGGEATLHLPYIEKTVEYARHIKSETKVNFDTNGYLTEESLQRVLGFTTSITYDIKAYHEEVHMALTGASSGPVLRNAEFIGKYAKDKLWEFRVLVIPKINDQEIRPITEFVADIDPSLPICFLAFRPNYALENHPGASGDLMKRCVRIAEESGLKNAYWTGYAGTPGEIADSEKQLKEKYVFEAGLVAGTVAFRAGCQTHPRGCSICTSNQKCRIKQYIPRKVT
ncbi:radical SAM protein [Thermodesulfobacteriota bacterium]